jgi:hypothetical protein
VTCGSPSRRSAVPIEPAAATLQTDLDEYSFAFLLVLGVRAGSSVRARCQNMNPISG